ncbi:hypothetical protein MYU51_007467 [Penicillium brevicompactum]|uniref:uncharacterized protein n=1 Tax=Penicillium brevicompactum TaxID=5074 RepID=UPI0025405E5D|nr:uncharacterized protein N7506_006001 [Penicillium brevicompactum]KAJ5332218.1 hypothetical protein N7506_006001 [Penicillium brevicompactum]
MASFNTPYPSATPALFDHTRSASLTNHDTNHSAGYLQSQTQTRSPSLTSSCRVSKAMKGKRVHACEHPGCPKVFTRAEHRRRHELSHEPKKQHTCSYEGCGKAFHRADYLHQHIARHAPPKSKAKKPLTRIEKSSPRSAQPQQEPPLAPQSTSPLPAPLIQEKGDYTGAWGSIDSSNSCSQCSEGLSHSPASVDEYPSPYSYTGETCSSPLPSDSFTNPHYPSSDIPVEMMTAIDQYLRTILKPEAFSVPEQQMNPTIWNPDLEIDPILMKMETQEQIPMYSWPTADSIQYEGHTTQMNQPQPHSH